MKYDELEVKPLDGEELDLVARKIKKPTRVRALDFALLNTAVGLVISSVVLAARIIASL